MKAVLKLSGGWIGKFMVSGLHVVFVAGAISWLTGCASIDSRPFKKFNAAIGEAQTGIDAAMSVNYDWTRSAYAEEISSNTNAVFSKLIIQPGAGYDWSLSDPPIYLTVKQVRTSLVELNGAFAQYASLLEKLASNDLVSTDTFDQLTKDLNKNANEAAKALKIDGAETGIALFSTAAAEIARLYIKSRQTKYLLSAIDTNQTNINNYATHCISLIHTIRGSVKRYYADRYQPIKIGWQKASPGKDRLKFTENMLELNEQFADILRVLQELETTYAALPKAHKDLSKAIQGPQFNLDGIQELYSSGRRLQRLYDDLKDAEDKAAKKAQKGASEQ